MPSATSSVPPSDQVRSMSEAPSVGISKECASRLRIAVCRLTAVGPEKIISDSVAPPIMNQVETSMLLTTSPRSIAWSRRRGVGSSVCSASSCSSAIGG